MTGPLDLQGRWWLPEHQDHEVFGTFRWDPATGGDLIVQGELRPIVVRDNVLPDGTVQQYRDHLTTAQMQYPVIRGRVGQKAYTLLDSFRLTAHEFNLHDSEEHVRVNRVLEGAWFDYPENLEADRIVVNLRHLTGWVDQTGLRTDYPDDGTGGDTFSVATARALPTLKAQHETDSVRFFQSLSEKGDRIHELAITQHWYLKVVRDNPVPIETLIETASHVQALVTIGVGATADFDGVGFQHPALPALSLAGTPLGKSRDSVAYYARWTNRSAPCDPVQRHDMYFTLADLGGIDAVGRWLVVATKYRTELSRVMATRYSESMFVEDRIMNVAAVLDSFDKVRRDTGIDVNYIDRIKASVSLAGEPFGRLIAQDGAGWAKAVKNTRHDLAHHRDSFRATGGAGDALLAEQLFWLFVMCMLRLAEAPSAVFDRIGEHGQIRWLSEQATARGPA